MAKNTLIESAGAVITRSLKMKDAEAVKPGHLVDIDSTPEVIKHATAGAAIGTVKVADDHLTSQKAAEDPYLNGEQVNMLINPPAFRGWLASGENVARGALLESAGGGELREHVPQAVDEGGTATYNVVVLPVVGEADEAVDASGGVKRIKVLRR